MELTFWGVRGSFPVARPHARLLGGNTPCIQLEAQGQHLIIDAGTGIRRLGEKMVSEHMNQHPVYMLVSHTHWDHIQGFPYFAPAYSEEYRLRVYSVRRSHNSLKALLSHQQDVSFFPVPLASLESHLEFTEMEEALVYELGPFRVSCLRLNHPGISAGFRVECGGAVFAYVCDVAPSRDLLLAEYLDVNLPEGQLLDRLYENQLKLAERADFVVYDSMFTPEQYKDRKHWGHSTTEDGVEVCMRAQARAMFMFHHNPERTDEELQAQLEVDRARFETDGFRIHAAAEGARWSVKPGEVVACA